MPERTVKLMLWGAIFVIMAAMYGEHMRLYYNQITHEQEWSPHAAIYAPRLARAR